MKEAVDQLLRCERWSRAYRIQRDTLPAFHRRCSEVLGAGFTLRPLDPPVLAPERNLFSTLFIAAAAGLGLDEGRLRHYAMVNQCMRALVTGCDNILDDEYKETIAFSVEGGGTKFLSVLTVMVADRVLSGLAADSIEEGRLSAAQAKRLTSSVLEVLLPSGLQEHEEEAHALRSPPAPEQVIHDIHHRKTGMLFQAPLLIIASMDDATPERVAPAADALHSLGLACQALDDLVDANADLHRRRPNLVISLAYHGDDESERDYVSHRLFDPAPYSGEPSSTLAAARESCRKIAAAFLEQAATGLQAAIDGFGPAHATALVQAITFAIAGAAAARVTEIGAV